MKRLLLLGLTLALLAVLTWWVMLPAPIRLGVGPRHQAYGVLYPHQAGGLTSARVVITALAYLAPPDQRPATHAQLLRALESKAERIDLGFATDRTEPVIGVSDPRMPPDAGTRTIPVRSLIQLRTLEHGYLLLRIEPAKALPEIAARRRWLEKPVAEIALSALSATITVGESTDTNRLIAKLAFDYRTTEEAEAALRRLTDAGASTGGYVAQPWARQIVRATKTLTISYEVDADLAARASDAR